MSYEVELVKNAHWIRLYCHLQNFMDSNLAPIPVDIKIQNIDSTFYNVIYATNFLEYNKITLSSKAEQFVFPDSVLAFKIPEHYESLKQKLSFAFKAFLPPHLEKIEFYVNQTDTQPVYTKYFSVYNEQNVLVEPDKTYAKWFIYSIAQKLESKEEIKEYCFEYDLHEVDTQAHKKDIKILPCQFDHRTMGSKNNVYYALLEKEMHDQNSATAQIVNGNLITNNCKMFFLGNNIYDYTDEITTVAPWAVDKKNI